MSLYAYTPDVTADVLELLPPMFRVGETTTKIFFSAFGKQVQYLEDLYNDLRQNLNLQTGNDWYLDIVGSWIELVRGLDDNNTFRARILAGVIQNTTGGQREDLLDILRLLGAENIKFWNLQPGWIQITYNAPFPVLTENQIAELLAFAIEPGALIINSYTATPFRFGGRSPMGGGFGVGGLGTDGNRNNGGLGL